MPSLIAACKVHFDTENLYEVLGVTKEATPQQVKKGYYTQSLKFHPDRAETPEIKTKATEKFQVLSQVYRIISDKEKRAIYDETGVTDDEDALEVDDWVSYWRNLFPRVTEKQIIEFEKQYIGSNEELTDLKNAFVKHSGDMDKVMAFVPYATGDSETRYRTIIDDWISAGDVEGFPAYVNETAEKKLKRKRWFQREAKEAAKEKSKQAESDLAALISARNSARAANSESFFAHLEAKYATKSSGPKRKANGASSKGEAPAKKPKKKPSRAKK